jgi:hypothetical protein
MANPDAIARLLVEVLAACLDRGMALPFTVAAVGVNGSILAVRYTSSADQDRPVATGIAEHVEGTEFSLPINIMVVDQNGDAVRIVIDPEGHRTFH